MKLIIDISEEIMEYIKNNGCLSVIYSDEVAKAIINGKPYEERPQGEWITQEQGAFYPIECSSCHHEPFCNDEGYVLSEFCPECGADMRGDHT